MLFEPYAQDLAERVAALAPQRILETAAGTGIVTEAIARAVPGAEIVATDLNQEMLDVAAQRVRAPNASFRPADAQSLPFEDGAFDLVVTQFGVMFFPDRIGAYREVRRVLKPGGTFLFNAWMGPNRNPIVAAVARSVAALFPEDPPGFLERTPYGYFDRGRIEEELRSAGFTDIHGQEVVKPSRSSSAREVALGLCQGSPLRTEIEQRDSSRLEEATAAAARALEAYAVPGGIEAPMAAHVFSAS